MCFVLEEKVRFEGGEMVFKITKVRAKIVNVTEVDSKEKLEEPSRYLFGFLVTIWSEMWAYLFSIPVGESKAVSILGIINFLINYRNSVCELCMPLAVKHQGSWPSPRL